MITCRAALAELGLQDPEGREAVQFSPDLFLVRDVGQVDRDVVTVYVSIENAGPRAHEEEPRRPSVDPDDSVAFVEFSIAPFGADEI